MKRVFCLAAAMLLMLLYPLSVFAVTPIDPNMPSSLEIHYTHDGMDYSDLSVRVYRVAEVFEDGTFALCGDFGEYPVELYGITSQAQWRSITSTLTAYVQADALTPQLQGTTDASGKVLFEDILPGIYLTMSVQVSTEQKVVTFESFLTMVPSPGEDDTHQYHVTAVPKCQVFTPTPEELELKVVKQWKDPGYISIRPNKIQVEILKNGELQSVQELSGANNWTYGWKAPNDGARWHVVERNVGRDYTVSFAQNGTTFIITNTYKYPDESTPQTGDTTLLWPYVVAMGVSGTGLILVAVLLRRRTK